MRFSRAPLFLGLGTGFAAVAALVVTSQVTELSCPAGYVSRDPSAVAREFHPQLSERAAASMRERLGERICMWRKGPESFMEVDEHLAARSEGRAGGSSGNRGAVEQKAAMKLAQASIPNALGAWSPYGTGPQVSDPAFPDGSNDGIPEVAGRVDNFAYDPVAKRLFAAVGNGGIWYSDAVGGDVGTLGDSWNNIGDGLPTLVNSAVAWTTAGGGRVIALSGEHVQGGNTYVGLGAHWSDDLGVTWNHSEGIPDGVNGSRLAVDPSNPSIVYAATGAGLFRSDDGGESFVNVKLPVAEGCAGSIAGACQLANFVSEVVVKQPGGTTDVVCGADGCPVLAAVGFRGGNAPYAADGVTPQSPGNGLYRSESGKPETFARVGLITGEVQDSTGGSVPVGFAPQNRIGRIEMGHAIGDAQDHNYVYALVQDAVLLNAGIPVLDLPTDDGVPALPVDCTTLPEGDPQFVCELASGVPNPTTLNGVYVSPDFGDTWIRMADDIEITYAGVPTGSSLAVATPLGIGPGAQAWYNMWIKPDPTQADPALGVPTRLAFGLEEIWKNRVNGPITGVEQTPNDFKVIGTYFAGNTCLFLLGNLGFGETPPVCPFRDGLVTDITTTHPDQQDAIFIPDGEGGVWLFAGNDGGVFKQHSADGVANDFDNTRWGSGANRGFFTLMNYGIGVAKDGTVYYGLQDNASGKIEPNGRHVRLYIGDGVYAAVDPNNSQIGYYQTPGLSIVRTEDGGATNVSAAPGDAAGTGHFLSPFEMDPRSAKHLVAAGTRVAESKDRGDTWTTVFDLSSGVEPIEGVNPQTRSRALDVEGQTIYAGWCGPCNVGAFGQFRRGLATNASGEWKQAAAAGLPNRYIYAIDIDPRNSKTVYVTLGGYSTARWLPDGQFLDTNANVGSGHVFKSTDGGESFRDISGNLPDTVATAIVERGSQLVVGTDIGVFISSDTEGSSWAPLGDLPSVPVNELELHPSDGHTLFAATMGRGVQTYRFASKYDNPHSGSITVEAPESSGTLLGGASPALLLVLAGLAALRRRRA